MKVDPLTARVFTVYFRSIVEMHQAFHVCAKPARMQYRRLARDAAQDDDAGRARVECETARPRGGEVLDNESKA